MVTFALKSLSTIPMYILSVSVSPCFVKSTFKEAPLLNSNVPDTFVLESSTKL